MNRSDEHEDPRRGLAGVDPGHDGLGHRKLGMRLDDVGGRLGDDDVLEVRNPVGFEAPGDQAKAGIGNETLELGQDERMEPVQDRPAWNEETVTNLEGNG